MYKMLCNYKEKNGNLKIDLYFKTLDGFSYSHRGVYLKKWLNAQQLFMEDYQDSEDLEVQRRITLLKELGVKPGNKLARRVMESWSSNYEAAKKYLETYGNLEVPEDYKTEKGVHLRGWIVLQRRFVKIKSTSIEQDVINKIEKLRAIGITANFQFQSIKEKRRETIKRWEGKLALAEAYKQHYKDYNIPTTFKTNDGVTFDENGFELGRWYHAQVALYNDNKKYPNIHSYLTKEMAEKLEKFGLPYKPTWDSCYNAANNFYKKYGHINLPHIKTINGIDFDKNGTFLDAWVEKQKSRYRNNRMNHDQRLKFSKFMPMLSDSPEWKSFYNLAKSYYEFHRHLLIDESFKTNDGVFYDEKGLELGKWIKKQKTRHYQNSKLISNEQIKMLENIGMIWNTRTNYKEVKHLCEQNGICFDYFKSDLIRISEKELRAKIQYMKERNMDLITNDKLNPFFFMSDLNLKAKYGLSREDLIRFYGKKR